MKRTLFVSVALLATISLAACGKPTSTKTSEGAQTGNPGQTAPVNATQDTVGAAVGQASAATLGSHDTGAFVSNASQSDMYEIHAAKLAQTRSQNADVKAFAKMMITEHTALMNEMKPLVMAAHETPATALDQRRQGFVDNLKGASDKDFDRTYLDQQVAAHEEAMTLMQGYGEHGADVGLKAGAMKAVARIQKHLDKAKAIRTALK